jgi:hypothetical protein
MSAILRKIDISYNGCDSIASHRIVSMTKTIEIKPCQTNPSKVCDCNVCDKLLNLEQPEVVEGKNHLEIWYGTGSNGKTTLLYELCSRIGWDKVINISQSWVIDTWIATLKGDTKIVVVHPIVSPNQNEFEFHDGQARLDDNKIKNSQSPSYSSELKPIMDSRPDVRFIMITNQIYEWMNDSSCIISEFPHKFESLSS